LDEAYFRPNQALLGIDFVYLQHFITVVVDLVCLKGLAALLGDLGHLEFFFVFVARELFMTIKGVSSKNPKRIISYGGQVLYDPFGL
jgi:hypothetical protein